MKVISTKPKYFNILLTFFITLFICFLLYNSKTISSSIKESIELFLYKLIPAIFPFIFITNMLLETGIAYNLTYGLSKVFSKIFNISPTSCPAIIIGFLLGYPNAATYLSQAYENKYISTAELTKLLSFTSNANPAFIISTIGISLYSNIQIGIILLISHFLSAVILGILLRNVNINIIQQKSKNSYTLNKKRESNIFSIVQISILKSLKTLSVIFSFTTIFSIISTIICNLLNLTELAESIVTALFEISNGMLKISNTTLHINTKIIIASFFLSFGSLMIIYQVYSVVHKCNVSIVKFIFYKIIHGILSAGISYVILMLFDIQEKTLPTFSNIQNTLTSSLPELVYILAITIIMLYIFFRKQKTKFNVKKDRPQ